MSITENKSIVVQYNKEVIEGGNMELLKDMVSTNFVNHSAIPGMPEGVDGLIYFFTNILHSAFAELQITIHDMIAEGDKVTTRKEITGTHQSALMGIPATGKSVTIKIIDILAIKNGKITDHWGENNFTSVLQNLQA